MMKMQKSIVEDNEEVNLYVLLNSDDAADTYIVINTLDILVTMPGSGAHLKKLFYGPQPPWKDGRDHT